MRKYYPVTQRPDFVELLMHTYRRNIKSGGSPHNSRVVAAVMMAEKHQEAGVKSILACLDAELKNGG